MKIAYLLEKLVDIPVGGEPSIHCNFINHLVSLGHLVDVYYEKNQTPADNTPYKKYEKFKENKEEYLKQLNKNNYDLIISSRFGLKFKELNADIYTIHSHSDLFSQKTKFGFLYNIIKPRKKRIKTEKEILEQNRTEINYLSFVLNN